MLPITLDPTAVPVAVAGRGEAALRRLAFLRTGGAAPKVFAPGAVDAALALAAGEDLVPRLPAEADLKGIRVLFVAGLPPAETKELVAAARRLGVLVNAEDQPEFCDFHVPAVVRRGDLTMTVATAGRSPALAHLLRRHLEREFDERWGERLNEIADWRQGWRAQGVPLQEITSRTEQQLGERGWL